ncbi:sensor histidine kinase [Massilia sp. CCM 8733]|uniref:Sensor histidine kinase n=1 Tax=Massilia mucilaginosa TaxID=2609282 RepID=A0ABX0P1L0_9BURK|nr:histidine kinase [Massilia mucilaginosa]NHZ92824.1 sensor histidine kinase [Massilia mucilaginosa]
MNANKPPAHTSSHPLDAIPLFRRWPCSPWRDVLYTGIWNFMIALFLTAANMLFKGQHHGFLDFFGPTLVISNVVGYLIHAVLSGGDYVLRGWPSRLAGPARVAYFFTTVGLCVVAGIVIGSGLLQGVNPLRFLSGGANLAPLLPFALFAALIMVVVLVSGERRIATETLAARHGEQIASAAQLLAEARLRALQAQIEPHFLYNTLATVVGLIETHPVQARHMLERFIDYLRASLAASRADQATLGAELDLAAAYLDVLAVRMGARLSYRIEADGCRDIAMPPMLLQPLIENAVAHGLEPKVDGGRIVIRATCRDELLCIEVSDTGAGLGNAPPKPGGGVGLSNLRSRLRSVYGPSAQVQLLENEPCGITVRLLLPLKETLPSTIHAP